MKNFIYIFFIFLSFLAACAHMAKPVKLTTCENNPQLQAERSQELLTLVEQDQADRNGAFDSLDWSKINQRDLERRARVATIFAEGCFAKASDYASAAMIYQHGTNADHYYQSFIWANQAVKLGDSSQKWLTAASLDRYLVKVGKKQLFGTQLSRNNNKKWCVQPVEPTFPEFLRIDYVKYSVKEQIARTLKGVGSDQAPDKVEDCKPALQPSPEGTVLGFW